MDDARGCAQKVGDLFTPILKVQRKKFREYCERLIFSDPILYGRKAEELLWRKSYYDVVASAKRLKKQEYTPEEIANIESHINSGIGMTYVLFSYEIKIEIFTQRHLLIWKRINVNILLQSMWIDLFGLFQVSIIILFVNYIGIMVWS